MICILCALYWTRCKSSSFSKKKIVQILLFFLLILSLQDMKIAENDFRLDIRPIIFAFAVILQLFGTFQGISFLTPSKTGLMFGLIPREAILSWKNKCVALSINIGAPRSFPIKSILSRKSGPIEGAQYAYHENRLQQQNFPHLRISKPS